MTSEAGDILAKHIKSVIAKSATKIMEYAQENHRFTTRTGALERSVKKEIAADGFSAVVFLDEDEAAYAPMVHAGTKSHMIYPKYKKVLRWSGGDGFVFAKRVKHPGTKPDEFLFKAADATKDEIQGVVDAETEKAAQEIAAQMVKDVMK